MSLPAKRRKISHDESDDGSSESSFASFGDSDESTRENSADDVNGDSQYEQDAHSGDRVDKDVEEDAGDDDDTEADSVAGGSRLRQERVAGDGPSKKAKVNGHRPMFRGRDGLQGTAYTAEVYKSNVFKLQVDDLLDRVRPRYGKNQGVIDRLLRTLKAIIEEIPDRPPATVRMPRNANGVSILF